MTAQPVKFDRAYGSIETRCGLDVEKMVAYEGFITSHCKNKVVCDIGTGPGILAYIALKAGAKKVYCIEDYKPSMDTAKINLSEFKDKVVFIQKDAGLIEYPKDIDIIIHEVLGSFIYDENILRIMQAVNKSNMMDRVYPNYYEMFTYIPADKDMKKERSTYDENIFPELTRQFHKLYDKNFPGVIQQHTRYSSLSDYLNTDISDVSIFHTWSMLDPGSTWGKIYKHPVEKFLKGDVKIGWRGYLTPEYYFGNYPRNTNNWAAHATGEHMLTKRLLNQVKLVDFIENPYKEETCQFLK